jgi:hypothetical protein
LRGGVGNNLPCFGPKIGAGWNGPASSSSSETLFSDPFVIGFGEIATSGGALLVADFSLSQNPVLNMVVVKGLLTGRIFDGKGRKLFNVLAPSALWVDVTRDLALGFELPPFPRLSPLGENLRPSR